MVTMYDCVIRGGRVIDPATGLDAVRDVAIRDRRIAAILDESSTDWKSTREIDVRGKFVVPGLIDLHVHVFPGVSHFGVEPDSTCLARGVTTVLDFGTTGGLIFPGFRRYVIEQSHTRVLALLNIASQGLIDSLGSPPRYGELHDLRHCDVDLIENVVERHRDVIVGIKIRCTANLAEDGKNEAPALELAREAADRVGLPLVIHSPNSSLSIEHILDRMKPGDVLTHCYHGKACGLVDANGRVRKSVRDKLEKGILLDVGHGYSSFDFGVARNLLDQGVLPDFISSDIHHYNLSGPVFDQVTTMDKFLHLGMSLSDVIKRSTLTPARFLGSGPADEPGLDAVIGTLSPGAVADITVLEQRTGEFPLFDSEGNVEMGSVHLEPTHVFRGGQQFGILPRTEIPGQGDQSTRRRF